MDYNANSYSGSCIEEITNLLYKIKDPGHLSSVHDWVIKLTTGEPNTCKSDCLRLLEYTLKSDRGVREPFTRPPPDGPLTSLNGIVRPVRSADHAGRINSLAAGGGISGNCAIEQPLICGPDEAVNNRKSDCAVPPELVELIDRMDGDEITLQKFMLDVRRNACDGGALMSRVADETLDDFRRTTQDAFDDRMEKLGDALAKEQAALLLRYRTNGQRMLSRAQILQDHVRELMPSFRYDEYIVEPVEYIRRMLAKNKKTSRRGNAVECEMESDGGRDTDYGDDDRMTTESEIVESAGQQKKLRCALNWLRSEVKRADCENAMLNERYDAVVNSIVAANKKKIANECHAKSLKQKAKTELESLRKESAKQVELVDCLVDKISAEKNGSKPTGS